MNLSCSQLHWLRCFWSYSLAIEWYMNVFIYYGRLLISITKYNWTFKKLHQCWLKINVCNIFPIQHPISFLTINIFFFPNQCGCKIFGLDYRLCLIQANSQDVLQQYLALRTCSVNMTWLKVYSEGICSGFCFSDERRWL